MSDDTQQNVLVRYMGPGLGNHIVDKVQGQPLSRGYTFGGSEAYRIQEVPLDDAKMLIASGQYEQVTTQQADDKQANDNKAQQIAADGGINTGQGSEDDTPSATDFLMRSGITRAAAENLVAAGFTSPDAIKSANDDQLKAVDEVGDGTLLKLRAAYGK